MVPECLGTNRLSLKHHTTKHYTADSIDSRCYFQYLAGPFMNMTLWSEINADKLILRLFLCPTSMMFPLRLAIFLESRAPWDHADACLSKREMWYHREMWEQLEGILKCPMAKFAGKHGHLFLLFHHVCSCTCCILYIYAT